MGVRELYEKKQKEEKAKASSSLYRGVKNLWMSQNANGVREDINNRVQNWANNYQSFINSHNQRFETTNNNEYRADAGRWASNAISAKMQFDKEANEIRNLLDEYKDFFVHDDWAGQVLTVLAQGEKGQSEIVNFATKDLEYWSNWDSEDAYKKALAEYEDYTAKANLDLVTEKKTIDELKIQIDTAKKGQNQVQALKTQIAQNENKLRTMGRYDLNAQKLEKQIEQDKATLAQLESQYGYLNVDALEKRLARKEQDYVLASRVQEGERLASVVNNADFEQFSEKGMNVENPTFDSIHNDYYNVFGFNNADEINDRITNKATFVRDNQAEAVKASAQGIIGGAGDTMPYYDNLLNQMTDEEVKIYSYYVGKGDYDTADRYLETLADTLAARQAGESFEAIENKPMLEILFGAAAGLDNYMSGVKNLGNLIKGEEDYIASSPSQHLLGMIKEDFANSDSKFWGALGTVAFDIVNTAANMLPSILVSTVPVLGGVLGSATLGASAAGNAYAEMVNLGYDKGQARTYAALIGGSEAGLQYLLGGISSLGGVANKGIMNTVLSKVDNALARTAIQIGGNMASEFTEEALQSILEPWFKSLVTKTDFEAPNIDEVLYSGLLGALTAGVLEGPGTIAGTMQTASTGRQIRGREGAVERLKNLGSTLSPESVAYKLAGKVNNNTGAYTIGRLFYEAGAQVNAQNKADIEKSLTRKGLSAKDANIISNAFEDIVNGAELTNSQKAIFESNSVVGQTILDILVNPNHTVNQRRMGMAEVASSLENTPQISMRDTKPTADTTQQAAEGVEGVSQPKPSTVSFNAPEVELSRFKASEDGVTRVSDSTEGTDIAYVEDIKDGNILLRTTDGQTVNADDVSFKDKETAYLYETLADMGISTPAEANRIIRGYDPNADITLEEYARGINEAYQYGAHGYAVTDISSKGMAALLSEEQRAEAHLSGKNTVWAKTMEQQAAIDKKKAEAVALGVKPKKGGVYFGDKVATESDMKGKLQKTSLKGLTFLSEALGADIHLFESYKNEKGKIVFKNAAGNEVTAPNGWINADGSIWIDTNAGNDGKGTMLYTASHELTHFIQRFSPAKYRVLSDFIVEKYSSNGKDFTTEVALKMERAKENGREIGEREAYDEVIADACSTMLLDSNAFRELASRDKTLAGKIKEFLEKFVAKIRAAYEKLSPDAREARFLRSLKEGLDEISAIWTEALVDAGETYRTIGERFSDVSGAKNTDGEQLFQYRAMESDKEIYREMLIKHGLMTDAEIDSLFNTIDKALAVITSHLEELDFAWDVDIDDRAFMPVKPNSDSLYQVSLDFSTLCRKRLLQQTVQATLQEALNRPLSKDEAIEIRNELMKVQEEGRQIEIACALCYVESARMKSPEQIKKFIDNKADLLKEFFAGKAGGTTKEKIAQAETRARQELNSKYNGKMPGKNNAELNPLTAKLNQMQKKDADVIRDAKKEAKKAYQPTAEQSALIEKAKEMTVNDFTTPDGLENLAKNYPLLFEAYTSYVRNATKSKGIEKDTWWRAGDSAVLIGDSLIEKMNAENGLRTQSWSDFQVIHILDYIASTIELSTRNSKMQAYTKVPDYVVLMGKTGTMINLSLIPTRSYLGELDYDSVEGMDYKEAKRLRNKYPETVGTVCIGINNEQIRKLLADFTIDYVIPYHKSGMSQDTRIKMHIPEWMSYEEFQTEKKLSRAEAETNAAKYNAKLLPETDENYHKAPKFSEWFDIDLARKEAREANEREGKDSSDIFGGYEAMRNAANTYKRLCAERGLTPKFSHEKADFTSEPNYWKLLIDRKMINHKTGEIIEQKAIKPIFDTKDVLGILNREVKRYAQVKEDQDYAARIVTERFLEGKRSLDKNEQNAIKKTVDNVTNVNIYESAPLIDVSATQRSERDAPTEATRFVEFMLAKGQWRVGEVVDYIQEHPSLNFVERIYNKDKTAKADLNDMLNQMDNVSVLRGLRWYISRAYLYIKPHWSGDQPYRGAVRTFTNAIDKRINQIESQEAGGENLGIENHISSIEEVRSLFERLNTSEELALLADKVFNTAEKLGVNIRFINAMSSGGAVGLSFGDMVEYKTSYFNNTARTNQRKAETLVHEMIHSCTSYAIHRYDNGTLENVRFKKLVGRLYNIFDQVRADSDFSKQYGQTDIHELLAELSNPEFVDTMQKKSLWQSIIDWLADFFGIRKGDSIYDGAMMCLDYMLENPDLYEYRKNAETVRRGMPHEALFGSVKYSERDQTYLDAVNRGDTETAQRMVDEAAKEAGYTVKGYHGTDNNFGFTNFENKSGAIFFTSRIDVAETYSGKEGVTPVQSESDAGNYSLFANLGNTYVFKGKGKSNGRLPVPEDYKNPYKRYLTTDEYAEYAKEKGYDSITFESIGDIGLHWKWDTSGTWPVAITPEGEYNVYAVFSPDQIKSADPVTYDDNGNVIPLSQRFNSSETDIRYSERDQAQIEQETEARNLLGEEISELDLDVKELNKMVKATKAKISESTEVINKVGRMLMEENAVRGRISDLTPLLKEFYSSIEKGDMVSWEAVNDAAAPAVDWIQAHYGVEDAYTKGILTDLRKRRIYLDETQKAEVASTYGSYNDFRRKAMGRVIIANTDSVSLDTAWQELAELYPEYFDAETNTNDMPAKLMEIVDTLQSAGEKHSYFLAEEMFEQSLAMQVYDSYWKAATLNAVSEAEQELSAEYRSKTQELRKNLNEKNRIKTKDLKAEQRSKTQELRENLKEKYRNKMQENKSKWQDAKRIAVSENTMKLLAKHRSKMQELRSKHKANEDKLRSRYQEMLKNARQRAVESRSRTELRHRIKKEVKALNNLLLRGTKDKHVMDGLQAVVAEALEAVNMDTVGASERIYGYVDENGKTHKGYNQLIKEALAEGKEDLASELTATRDRIAKQGDGIKSKLEAFKNAYANIRKSNDPSVASMYYEEIENKIESVVDKVGNTPLRFMSESMLEEVLDLYKMVHKVIRDSNKAFRAEKSAKITENAETVASQIFKEGGEKEYMNKVQKVFNRLGFSMLKPEYFFKMLGSERLLDLYHNLRKGEDTFYKDIEEGKKFFDSISEKYKYREWVDAEPKTFTAAGGKTFKLGVEEMMAIYAYTRRDLDRTPGEKGLDATKHLTEGGIVLTEDVTPTRKFGIGKILGYTVNTKRAYRLKPETVGEIVASLTEDQKHYVEQMQEFLSSVMGAKGNEVTMELFGIKGFKEKYYFPIKSSSYYMGFKPQEAGEVRIKNPSFSKDRVPNANNPVVLTGFTDVWKKHVEDMSMYHSFTLPLEDFTRVYNYRTKSADDTDTTSVKATISSAYGVGATDYIEKFLRDLNGGVRTEKADILDSMISLSKKGSVMASASVVVQQYSALTRAFALVDPKYFVKSLPQGVNLKNHSKDWEELKTYAPIAGIKEMGRFDTGMGRSTGDWIAGKQTVREKMDDILSKAPAFADEVVWVQIWQAVKRETVHNNPNLNPKSEEFLQKAGERFTEVVSLTQVYDSVFSRSGMMRSQNTLMKMATAFMAEPTVQLNMLAEGLVQGKKLGLKMGTLYASRVAGSVASSLVLNAALKSIVMAARDDDEDETYAEKYVEAFSGDLLESINPLTMIPIAKDILSIFKGYEVKRMDMNLFSDLVRAFENLDRENISQPEKWADLAGAISAFFGVPLKNVKRDIMSVINVISTVASDNKTTAKGLRDAILEGITGDEKSVTDKLYEAISSGDEAYLKEVQKQLEGKNYSTYVRKALRENDARIRKAAEAGVNGDVEERVRIAREIIAEGNFSQDDVVAAINSEMSAIRNATAKEEEVATTETEVSGTATSVYKATDIVTAFENGDTSLALEIIEELVDTHIANGKTEKEAKSSVRSSMTSKLKPMYIAADSETRSEIRFFMKDSGLYGRASDILDTCKNWLKDA